MLDVFDKYDVSWLCKRFCSLLVDFSDDLTLEKLENDELCSQYNVTEVYEALKSAHTFLTEIAHELLVVVTTESDKQEHVETVFSKIDLLWALCILGKLKEENSQYCLCFEKVSLKVKKMTLPDNYSFAFQNIIENGCYVEFYKYDKPVINYNSCDRGILHFDNRLTALGLYLFIQKAKQKRWYWDNDKAGRYSKGDFVPIIHCVEPYYRADMRIFTCV